MAGIADPYVAEEDEEESGSEASGSEQSSHLPEEASDTGKSHEKNVVGERERASVSNCRPVQMLGTRVGMVCEMSARRLVGWSCILPVAHTLCLRSPKARGRS